MENKNIQHSLETLVKIAKKQQNNAKSMHFDCEANALIHGEVGTSKLLCTYFFVKWIILSSKTNN